MQLCFVSRRTFFILKVPINCLLSDFVGAAYFVLSGRYSWDEASARCPRKEGYLPWTQKKEDLLRLSREMEANRLQTSWIGIKRTYTSDPRWLDGTKLGIIMFKQKCLFCVI